MSPATEWTLDQPSASPAYTEPWLAVVALLRSGRAPHGLRVRGSLILSHLRLLPPGLEVEGDLDLRCCERLRRVGDGLVVSGDLLLGGGASLPAWLSSLEDRVGPLSHNRFIPLHRLPDPCRVGRDLVLVNCHHLEHLPGELQVGGSVSLRGCRALRRLPDSLCVERDLTLVRCDALAALPEGLVVRGSLHLERCLALTGWPAKLTVEGDLVVTGCPRLSLLPHGLGSRRASPRTPRCASTRSRTTQSGGTGCGFMSWTCARLRPCWSSSSSSTGSSRTWTS